MASTDTMVPCKTKIDSLCRGGHQTLLGVAILNSVTKDLLRERRAVTLSWYSKMAARQWSCLLRPFFLSKTSQNRAKPYFKIPRLSLKSKGSRRLHALYSRHLPLTVFVIDSLVTDTITSCVHGAPHQKNFCVTPWDLKVLSRRRARGWEETQDL